MYKAILVTSLVAISSLPAAEPSAFGAGNLDSPSPYGLTSSEKAVLQNKQNLKQVVVKTKNQDNKVESLRERIDGLQSIVESLSIKSQKNKRSILQLKEKSSEELKSSDEYEKRLSEVSEKNSKIIEELSKLIKDIDRSYVTKNEFNALVKDINSFKELVAKEIKSSPKQKKSSSSSLDKLSNPEVATEAKKYYDKKYYTKAIEYYSHLILKHYKPAYAHFMIGQMKFKRKDYGEAISFYKKSASLYSKASYMPELMLNTAISMDRTKDKKNAKSFYSAVIAKYPDSSEAKSAKKYLNSLK